MKLLQLNNQPVDVSTWRRHEEFAEYPVFDNGTSMGHEISSIKFKKYGDNTHIERYVLKGHHHIKWGINDHKSMKHIVMVKKFTQKYPKTQQLMVECLRKITLSDFKTECRFAKSNPQEFQLREHNIVEVPLNNGLFTRNAKLTITKQDIERTYLTGNGTHWVVDFANDIQKGVFN